MHGCCCWTATGVSHNMLCRNASGAARREAATPARSIRWPRRVATECVCRRATKFPALQLVPQDLPTPSRSGLGIKTSTAMPRGGHRGAPGREISAGAADGRARQFTGSIRQVPPMHSALKKDGKALYEYPARVKRWRANRARSSFPGSTSPLDTTIRCGGRAPGEP